MATRARRALDKGAKRGHGCPTCTGDAGSAAHYSNAHPDSDGCPAPRAANELPAARVDIVVEDMDRQARGLKG